MCEFMPTDKQHDSMLIDVYSMLMRIRKIAVLENSEKTISAIDDEVKYIKLKLRPLTLSDVEEFVK